MSNLESENKAVMVRVYEEMWNRKDLAIADEIFAHPEGVQRFVSEFLKAFPDLRHTVEELIAEGDQVAVRFSAQGTHTGQWRKFPPSGNPVHYTGVTIARLNGGQIVQHRTWWETMEVIDQISVGQK